MNDKHYSCRCVVCSLNWPWSTHWAVCPQCGEATKPVNIHDPSAHIMDWEEAIAYCEANDLRVPEQARRKHSHRAKPIMTKGVIEAEVAKLHSQLDRWAEERPDWMRR